MQDYIQLSKKEKLDWFEQKEYTDIILFLKSQWQYELTGISGHYLLKKADEYLEGKW